MTMTKVYTLAIVSVVLNIGRLCTDRFLIGICDHDFVLGQLGE